MSSSSTWSSRSPATASGTVAVHCRFSVALALLTNRLSAEKTSIMPGETESPKDEHPSAAQPVIYSTAMSHLPLILIVLLCVAAIACATRGDSEQYDEDT